MFPLVLGGIALAAVGYGVKEYCESEGCPWDEDLVSPTERVPIFEKLHTSKVNLHDAKLLKLKELLLRLEHSDMQRRLNDPLPIHKEHLADSETEEDIRLYASMYQNMLDAIAYKIDHYTAEIEDLLSRSHDYSSYTKADKKRVKRSAKLVNQTQALLGLRLLDGKALNIEVIAPLKAMKEKIGDLRYRSSYVMGTALF